jgi:hypothetical protein
MKRRIVGMLVALGFLSIATPVNRVHCGPAVDTPRAVRPGELYDFDHSFSAIISAGREIDRRISLCGDSSLRPTS